MHCSMDQSCGYCYRNTVLIFIDYTFVVVLSFSLFHIG